MSCFTRFANPLRLSFTFAVALVLAVPTVAVAGTVANPLCSDNTALFNPSTGSDIILPAGFTVSVFKAGLNFPTGIAFLSVGNGFDVFVLESGHGLPSKCNEQGSFGTGEFDPTNPFTPDILVFDQSGTLLRTLAKPTSATNGFQAAGPAIDIAFEKGVNGGRLFATDSNQATHAAGQNNSSRIVTVDPMTGQVTPFIIGLPTGDHPTEQLAFKGDGWIYWSQGSTTNSGVVGRDNGGGTNQQDIPCQDIVLSDNVFDSGGGVSTSGYSAFGTTRKGATVKAFESALHHGVCDGAILRAKLNVDNPETTIEPFSWGYRNGYAIRFAPENHVLKGGLLVGEDGADERGARPSNNAPDALHLAQQNKDGSPDYHGWPDRFGFLDSTQAVFNPVGGPGDDNPAAVIGKPVLPVLAFRPQPITAPLELEASDVAIVGLDFVPDSFVFGPVKRGAALAGREGDFGFSKANGTPEEGHDVQLINFSKPGEPLQLNLQRFAHNTTFEQAFVDGIRGINRPVDLKFGPDDCAYLVDYGAVRDFGQSDPDARFCPAKLLNGQPNPAFPGCLTDGTAPLVQIPGTGVIWKICRAGGNAHKQEHEEEHAKHAKRDN